MNDGFYFSKSGDYLDTNRQRNPLLYVSQETLQEVIDSFELQMMGIKP